MSHETELCAHESGCERPVHAQDLCSSHYGWYRNRAPRFRRYHPGRHGLTDLDKSSMQATCGPCSEVSRRGTSYVCKGLARDGQLKNNYGVSLEWLDTQIIKAGNRCEICGSPPGAKGLFVDHCHVGTGVRGLLCEGCNFMLGQAHDRPEILRLGAAYLERRA